MRARTTLLGWLRGDRGEADPIAVVAGTIVYLLASAMVAGSVTMALGASTQAQGNTQLTQKVEAYVAQWQTKSYSSFNAVKAPVKSGTVYPATPVDTTLTKAANGFDGTQRVYKDSIGTVHLTVAAGRAHGLAAVSNCATVFTAITAGTSAAATDANAEASHTGQDSACIVLQGVVSPTPFDVTPKTLPGITQVATKVNSQRGINIATVNIAQVQQSDGIDLRVNVLKPAALTATDMNALRLTLTCNDTTPFADTPDSQFVAASTTWWTARVKLTNVMKYNPTDPTVCPTPALRLWENINGKDLTTAQFPVTNVNIWRVAGATQ